MPLNDVSPPNGDKEKGWSMWCNNLNSGIIESLSCSEKIFNLNTQNFLEFFNINLYMSNKDSIESDFYKQIITKSIIKETILIDIDEILKELNSTKIRKIIRLGLLTNTNKDCWKNELALYLPLPVVEIILSLHT